MADEYTDSQIEQQIEPYPGLRSLDKLVGTWRVSGPDVKGRVIFEWMDGGFFLMQHVDFVHSGHKVKGIEIIGYERGFGPQSQVTIYGRAGSTTRATPLNRHTR